jgi:hypothetical protein
MYPRIVSTNKRNRTITIKTRVGNKYRSNRLPKKEFNYYTNYATQNDVAQFLKSNDYYPI